MKRLSWIGGQFLHLASLVLTLFRHGATVSAYNSLKFSSLFYF